jgi:hypothetical protein
MDMNTAASAVNRGALKTVAIAPTARAPTRRAAVRSVALWCCRTAISNAAPVIRARLSVKLERIEAVAAGITPVLRTSSTGSSARSPKRALVKLVDISLFVDEVSNVITSRSSKSSTREPKAASLPHVRCRHSPISRSDSAARTPRAWATCSIMLPTPWSMLQISGQRSTV